MNSTKKDIRSLSLEELSLFFSENNEKPFRAKQVMEWIWKKSSTDFEQMTNISQSLRTLLQESFSLSGIQLHSKQISNDGTVKCAFEVEPNKIVEGVLIPSTKRMTACISCQVGCSLACEFCATGTLKLQKNLTSGEIYDQVVYLKNEAEERL